MQLYLYIVNISQAVFSFLTETQPQTEGTEDQVLLHCEAALKHRPGSLAAPLCRPSFTCTCQES